MTGTEVQNEETKPAKSLVISGWTGGKRPRMSIQSRFRADYSLFRVK